jgi:endonuclease I
MATGMVNVHDYHAVREMGMRALVDALGTDGTVYFLRQFNSGSGDWTEERREALADATMEGIEKDIHDIRSGINPLFRHTNMAKV